MRSDTANPDSFRKFLLVALATGALLLMLPIAAGALSCAMPVHTLGEAYDAADSIIIGLVTECVEPVSSDPWANGGAGCSFDSLEVLKAANPARDYRGTADSHGCGLSLQVGNQYLLFLDEENRPLRYSAGLNSDRGLGTMPREHVRILRQFRDGAISDLSDPWYFWEHEGTCTISHRAGAHTITFTKLRDGALPSASDFSREIVDGNIVLKGKAVGSGETLQRPEPDVTIVMPTDTPENPFDVLMLNVMLAEPAPDPERRVVLTVGSATWPLHRMETSISCGGGRALRAVAYHAGGESAEEILSAMLEPSDVVVYATLVTPPTTEAEPPSAQPAFSVAPDGDIVLSPTPSVTTGSISPSVSPDPTQSARRRQHLDPPEPVIRIETRSTQLPAAIKSFSACSQAAE